jgi:hypothetical protein
MQEQTALMMAEIKRQQDLKTARTAENQESPMKDLINEFGE